MKEEELEKQKKKRKIIYSTYVWGLGTGAGWREGREGDPGGCTILSNPDVQEMVISRPAESSALL